MTADDTKKVLPGTPTCNRSSHDQKVVSACVIPVHVMRHSPPNALAVVFVVTIKLFSSYAFVESFSKYAIHRNDNDNRCNPPFRVKCAFHREGTQIWHSCHSFQPPRNMVNRCNRRHGSSSASCFAALYAKSNRNPEEAEAAVGANTSHDKIRPVATSNVVGGRSVNQSSSSVEVNNTNSNGEGSKQESTIQNRNAMMGNQHESLQENTSFLTSSKSYLHVLVDTFQVLKKSLYAKIRQLWVDLVSLIQRSMKKSTNWVQNDEMGQLISSAVALIVFFASVAAFAVWNIEVLGGKKFSGPTKVTVPVVQFPTGTDDGSPRATTFQKPKWKAPQIRTSYSTPQEEVSVK